MYAKLFASLYEGTLRGCADEILVFTNLLAYADSRGIVDRHWRIISEDVGISRERVMQAIANLESPDPESRSPDEGGRRIVRLDDHRVWGWRIVNHSKYRAIRHEEDRRVQNRIAQEKWRNKQNKPRKPRSAHSEAEAEAKADTEAKNKKDHSTASGADKRGSRLSDDWQLTPELRDFASDLGLDPDNAREEFVDYWTAVPGSRGLKLDWGKTFKNRCRELAKKPRNGGSPAGETWNERRIRLGMEALKK